MYPKTIQNFIEKFSKLPGIGQRQAARLAFWLLNGPKETRQNLKQALENLDKDARACELCHYVIENDGNNKCHFCDNSSRDHAIILVLSPTHEGDLTAYYLEKLLKPLKVKVTRLGRGLSYGSDVEFADVQTLSGALESRKEIK